MKQNILFTLMLMSTLISFKALSYEDISELPEFICSGVPCSNFQSKILNEFLNASTISSATASVYSGKCFHLSPSYDSNYAHYGVIYIIPAQNNFFWGGLFSFFSEVNPFADMDVRKAQEKFGKVEENSYNQFENKGDYLFANYGNSENFTRYWIRQSKDEKHLFVLGLWGVNHRLMCDFIKNIKQ